VRLQCTAKKGGQSQAQIRHHTTHTHTQTHTHTRTRTHTHAPGMGMLGLAAGAKRPPQLAPGRTLPCAPSSCASMHRAAAALPGPHACRGRRRRRRGVLEECARIKGRGLGEGSNPSLDLRHTQCNMAHQPT